MPRPLDLAGIIPPIPTPFQENEEFYPKALEANLCRWNEVPFRGYLILGSNGEAIHLNQKDQLCVLETARGHIPEDRLLLVGASQSAAKDTVEFLRQAATIGADAALVSTPCYFKSQMNQGAVLQYYTRIAEESPLPILLYNVPQFTGLNLAADTVIRLAKHANVLGLKESAGNMTLLCEVFQDLPVSFQVLCGSAGAFYSALNLGAVGGILAVACVAWEACFELFESTRRGDQETARRKQLELVPLAQAVTAQFGVGGLKAALAIRGFYGGPPRAPLTPPGEWALGQLRQICATMKISPPAR
ncbi:MAG: dihydrodipicolinate synthase family protein [Acidobacteria bacterium]|nr:dihydrodipicolinate synthase family protein [Acidobacteriota bacterium]